MLAFADVNAPLYDAGSRGAKPEGPSPGLLPVLVPRHRRLRRAAAHGDRVLAALGVRAEPQGDEVAAELADRVVGERRARPIRSGGDIDGDGAPGDRHRLRPEPGPEPVHLAANHGPRPP